MSELKYLDTAWSAGFAANRYGVTRYISGTKQGDGGTQRVGDRVNIVAVHVRGSFLMTGGQFGFVQWSLVLDRQSNGSSTLDVGDVYTYDNTSLLALYGVQRLDTQDRFSVLYESPTYGLSGVAAAPSSAYTVFVDEVIPVNVQVQYGDSGLPDVPDPAITNAVYVVMRRSPLDVQVYSGLATMYFTD